MSATDIIKFAAKHPHNIVFKNIADYWNQTLKSRSTLNNRENGILMNLCRRDNVVNFINIYSCCGFDSLLSLFFNQIPYFRTNLVKVCPYLIDILSMDPNSALREIKRFFVYVEEFYPDIKDIRYTTTKYGDVRDVREIYDPKKVYVIKPGTKPKTTPCVFRNSPYINTVIRIFADLFCSGIRKKDLLIILENFQNNNYKDSFGFPIGTFYAIQEPVIIYNNVGEAERQFFEQIENLSPQYIYASESVIHAIGSKYINGYEAELFRIRVNNVPDTEYNNLILKRMKLGSIFEIGKIPYKVVGYVVNSSGVHYYDIVLDGKIIKKVNNNICEELGNIVLNEGKSIQGVLFKQEYKEVKVENLNQINSTMKATTPEKVVNMREVCLYGEIKAIQSFIKALSQEDRRSKDARRATFPFTVHRVIFVPDLFNKENFAVNNRVTCAYLLLTIAETAIKDLRAKIGESTDIRLFDVLSHENARPILYFAEGIVGLYHKNEKGKQTFDAIKFETIGKHSSKPPLVRFNEQVSDNTIVDLRSDGEEKIEIMHFKITNAEIDYSVVRIEKNLFSFKGIFRSPEGIKGANEYKEDVKPIALLTDDTEEIEDKPMKKTMVVPNERKVKMCETFMNPEEFLDKKICEGFLNDLLEFGALCLADENDENAEAIEKKNDEFIQLFDERIRTIKGEKPSEKPSEKPREVEKSSEKPSKVEKPSEKQGYDPRGNRGKGVVLGNKTRSSSVRRDNRGRGEKPREVEKSSEKSSEKSRDNRGKGEKPREVEKSSEKSRDNRGKGYVPPQIPGYYPGYVPPQIPGYYPGYYPPPNPGYDPRGNRGKGVVLGKKGRSSSVHRDNRGRGEGQAQYPPQNLGYGPRGNRGRGKGQAQYPSDFERPITEQTPDPRLMASLKRMSTGESAQKP